MVTNPFGSGGEQAQQFLMWGVGFAIANSIMRPVLQEIENKVWANGPDRPLSPADLADMFNRGIIENLQDVVNEAAESGIDSERINLMVKAAGEPPGLQLVLELFRRGYIPWNGPSGSNSVSEAIRTGRIYTHWTDAIHKGHLAPPSVAEAVDARIRNQIDEATALKMAYYAGLGLDTSGEIDPELYDQVKYAFDILTSTAGRPPSPTELAELVHRGKIPEGSPTEAPDPKALNFFQGIFEGDLKDKWAEPLSALLTVLPSIYEIRILQEHNAISSEQATTWLNMQGYPSGVAESIAADATSQAVITDRKETETIILKLYQAHFLTEAQAKEFLTALGYSAEAVGFMVASADLQYMLKALNGAVGKIGTYYIAKKISSDTARADLQALELTADQITQLLQEWEVERTSNVRLPTEAQIVDAWEYKVIDEPTAQSKLEALGYSAYDAWMLLSVKNKAPLPNPPPESDSRVPVGGLP